MPESDFSEHPIVQAIDSAIDALTYLQEDGTKSVAVSPEIWKAFITPSAPLPAASTPKPLTPMPELPPPSQALRGNHGTHGDTPEIRTEAHRELYKTIQACHNCQYAATSRFVGYGCTYNPRILVVNGACLPGENTTAIGSRLEGEAGELLRKMFAAIHLTEADLYITSALKCPVSGRPGSGELNNCAKHLHREIQLIQPEIIVMLGDIAAKATLPGSIAATGKVGQWHLFAGKIPAIKLYHPMRILLLDEPLAHPLKQENWTVLKLIQVRLHAKN